MKRGPGVGSRESGVRAVVGLVVMLAGLMLGAGTASAQAPASLRAAMLYGHGPDVAAPAPRVLLPDTTLSDPWLGRDKVLHVTGSFLLTLSAQYVLTSKLAASEHEALPIAAGAALSLGLAKEVADSQRPVHPLFSTRDLVADAVGVALAVGLILL